MLWLPCVRRRRAVDRMSWLSGRLALVVAGSGSVLVLSAPGGPGAAGAGRRRRAG